MALVYSGIQVELREVKLSDMPDAMLQLSPKATVPVLALSDGQVVDESLEVMVWSLSQSDPEHCDTGSASSPPINSESFAASSRAA
jgi:glutathione S-transferase